MPFPSLDLTVVKCEKLRAVSLVFKRLSITRENVVSTSWGTKLFLLQNNKIADEI